MSLPLDQLRALVAQHRAAPAAAGFPLAIRQAVASHALPRHQNGERWSQIGADLGLSSTTIVNWTRELSASPPKSSGSPSFVPVLLTDVRPVSPTLTLLSPSGFRIEGLDLDTAVALLQRLA